MRKILSVLALSLVIFGCKKEVVGPQGPQGEPGPGATTKTFTLTFNPGDTYQYYNPSFTDFSKNDIMLVYLYNNTYGSSDYYVQLPAIASGAVNVYPEVSEDGDLFINTDKADGSSGSPWLTSVTLGFKVVHIKSSAMALHPEVNWKDDAQVEQFVKETQF